MADVNDLTTLAKLKAWLKPKPKGSISAVTPLTGGAGYASVPTVTITDAGNGIGAVATAVLTDGVVTSYEIVAQGSDYINPSVSITGGGGTGATATAAIDEDEAIALLITGVSCAIMAELPGLVAVPNTVFTEIHSAEGGGILSLRKRPVTSVDAVTIGTTSILSLPNDAVDLTAAYQWRLDALMNSLHLYAGAIGNYRDQFLIGTQNVVVTYKAGLPANDPRRILLDRYAIDTAALWWNRNPYAHVSSESASQGMGTSISINTADFPSHVKTGIERLNREALAL